MNLVRSAVDEFQQEGCFHWKEYDEAKMLARGPIPAANCPKMRCLVRCPLLIWRFSRKIRGMF